MFIHISQKRFWKVLGWITVALLINLLMILSLQTTLLSLDYGGMAFAQTGPPDDTPTPIPTAAPGPGGDIIIDVSVDVSPGDGGGSGDGGGGDGGGRTDDSVRATSEAERLPTPTFTPLPLTTVVIPPRFVTETIFVIGVTPVVTITPVVEATPIPLPDFSACELASIAGAPGSGLPSLAGHGAVYQIPPAPGESFLQVTTKLGLDVCNCTLTVPTSPTQCIIAELDQDPGLVLNPPAPLPANIRMLVPFNIDIYGISSSQTITEITFHSPPLVFTTDPLDVSDTDKVVLLRYDETEQNYMFPQQQYNPATKILQAFISNTSFFVLGISTEEPLDQMTATPEPAPPVSPATSPEPLVPTLSPFPEEPSTLPETGDGLSLLWLFLAILAGLLGIIALFLLLGGARALREMLQGAPPPAMAQNDNDTGGLALGFGLQMPDVTPLIRVTLAALPAATALPAGAAVPAARSAQPDSPHSRPPTRLNLPSVEMSASISAVKPGLMRARQAITIPDDVDLVGWNELGLHPRKLSHTVLAGRLDWHSRPDEVFIYLQELELEDVIEIQGQSNIYYQYIVDEVQNYQADTSSVVEIPQASTEMELVLIAWGEAYDVEEQVYRDYIVIRAYQADTSLEDRLEMSKAEMLAAHPVEDVE